VKVRMLPPLQKSTLDPPVVNASCCITTVISHQCICSLDMDVIRVSNNISIKGALEPNMVIWLHYYVACLWLFPCHGGPSSYLLSK